MLGSACDARVSEKSPVCDRPAGAVTKSTCGGGNLSNRSLPLLWVAGADTPNTTFEATDLTPQKPMRVALLLQWRDRGYLRPPYGLVDDEELLRTGRSTFLGTDGRTLLAHRDDLLLLLQAASDTASEPPLAVSAS